MFFLTRAALCIGLVALAASQADGGSLASALDHEARDAAAGMGRACLASSECLRVGSGVLAATSPLALPDAGFTPPHRAARLPAPVPRPPDATRRRDIDRVALRRAPAPRG